MRISRLTVASVVLTLVAAGGTARADQPFQASGFFTLPAGVGEACFVLVDVPDGKRLTVEYVSATFALPTGQRPYFQGIHTTANGTKVYHGVSTERVPKPNEWMVAQSLRLYADPTTSASFCMHRTGTVGAVSVFATLSGVLADVP